MDNELERQLSEFLSGETAVLDPDDAENLAASIVKHVPLLHKMKVKRFEIKVPTTVDVTYNVQAMNQAEAIAMILGGQADGSETGEWTTDGDYNNWTIKEID